MDKQKSLFPDDPVSIFHALVRDPREFKKYIQELKE